MDFRPRRTAGTGVGLVITLVTMALTAILAERLIGSPASLFLFSTIGLTCLLAALALFFAYWTIGCRTLRYSLNRNNLTIRWALTEINVPIAQIRAAHKGEGRSVGWIRGINWPGYHIGSAAVQELGDVFFFATDRSPRDLLYLVTPYGVYALSVRMRDAFLEELRMLQRLGPTSSGPQVALRRSLLRLPVAPDRFTWVLGIAGLFLNLALFAYIFNAYPSLPQILPLSFTPLGEADRVGLRQEVFRLPLLGLAILGGNWVIGLALERWERLAAYLCFAAALLAQPLFWIAIVRIVQ